MNPTRASLNHPFAVAALVLLVAAIGLIGYTRTPVDLFPDTSPPQVVVITVQPGASAGDIEDRITEPVETEMNTLGGLESIRSTSRDGVSSVVAEFEYSKDPGQAVVEAQNAVARIRADLPDAAQAPQIYRLSESTSRPLLTLALRPKEQSSKDLLQVRLLAENEIKERILRLEGVADVDVFGGHRPEVRVRVDRDRLAAHSLTLSEVIGALSRQNVSAPAGTVYTEKSEYLVRVDGELEDLQSLRDLPLRRTERGLLRLSDIAGVELGEREPRSLYRGNGEEAIALGILEPDNGATVETIERFKGFLPELKARYPDIAFAVTQDQQPLIDINMEGMVRSIVQAVLLTVAVIFLFLADARASLTAGVSLPLSFLFTLGVLWITPYTLNMVTLTGLIVATGLVVDSSVVVLENIYRHYRSNNGTSALQAAINGTREVDLANIAGTMTTVAVLLPVIFIGGYPQRTIGRLSLTISTTLLASLLVSLTVVPLITSTMLGRRQGGKNPLERWAARFDALVDRARRFFLLLVRGSLRLRWLVLLLAAAFFALSVRTVPPLIGGELMPRMDTGIVTVEFNLPATDAIETMEDKLERVEDIVYAQPGVEMVSSVVGSEPGALGFGSGGAIAQSAVLTVHLVDRTERSDSIWRIMERWREELRRVSGIKSFRVSEFGATPMSTTKAPLDIVVSGPDPQILDRLADRCLERLKGVPGLVDVRRSWHFDEQEHAVRVDPALARVYDTSPGQVATELQAAVKGVPATQMRLEHFLNIPVRVAYQERDIASPEALRAAYVPTAFGPVPLRALAGIESRQEQPFVTREDLQRTVDITGVNHGLSIAQVTAAAQKRIATIEPPGGYSIAFDGTVAEMKHTQQRLKRSLIIGIVFLYLLLVAMFRSFLHPLTVMVVIPVAISGSLWGLLLFDKSMSMPGNMGMIFLAGIVINNSILIVDFINRSRKEGMSSREAALRAVELRVRPILMTMLSTVVGLSPLAFEMAVGLERLSPLAVVAGTGILIGPFLTMVLVPVVYSLLDSLKQTARKA